MKASAGRILAVVADHMARTQSDGLNLTVSSGLSRLSTLNSQLVTILIALCLALIATGCSRQAKLERHLTRGQNFFKAEQYNKAEIEFLNVLRLDETNIVAMRDLGFTYFQQGRWLRSFAVLHKTSEFTPQNEEIRLRLAAILVAVRNLKDARAHAEAVLARNPGNDEALVLLSETIASTNDVLTMQRQLEASRPQAGNKAGFHLASGIMEARQRRTNEAATAFQRALSLDAKSSAAHIGLANLAALSLDNSQVEFHLSKAAEFSPVRSPRQFQYVDFKIRSGDLASAKTILGEIIKKAPDYVPAYSRLAEIALTERQFDQAASFAKKMLNLDPGNYDGLILSARIRIAKGDARGALADFERLANAYPRLPQAHYHLGVAHLLNENPAAAIKSLQQVLALDPKYTDATLLLAEINLRQNNAAAAVSSLKQLVQEQPRHYQAQLALAKSYRAANQSAAAAQVYETLTKQFPNNPQPHFAWGQLLLAEGRKDNAKQQFERVLQLAPDFLPAIEELANLDMAAGQFPAAETRIASAVSRNPKAAGLHVLAAKVYSAQKKYPAAEQALTRAIALEPNYDDAYLALARVYVDLNQPQAALERLNTLVARSTNNVTAWLQLGMVQHQSKNYAAARDAYERLLAIDPKFFPALNNLASLYAENLGQLDRAYALAKSAHDLRPGDPVVADTLGWILFKRGDYSGALTQLQDSAAKLTKSSEVQFHLGMTYYTLGNEAAARAAFEKALAGDQDFPGRAEAQAKLASLSSSSREPAGVADLEKQLAANPRDPLLLGRLASAYEQAGTFDKAAATYNTILQQNPRNVSAMVKAAQLYAGPLADSPKALQLARNARSLAPDDPAVARLLGALAFASGDYRWSLGLLEEGARGVTNQPQLLYDLAWARYSAGRVTEAVAAMKQAIAAGQSFARKNDASRFIELNSMALQPETANAASVRSALEQDAAYVPALFASAVSQQRTSNAPPVREQYEAILKRFPDFVPAHKGLAVFYSQSAPTTDSALRHATRAREALPGDPEVARAFGVIAFHRKDYGRAAQLLNECLPTLRNDAEAHYYLGMAHFHLKQNASSRTALERAVSLNPQGAFAAEARRTLAQLN